MTATDHEAAIRDVLPPCSCPEPHFVNRCFSCIALDHLDALVGLLQQAEQRAEEWEAKWEGASLARVDLAEKLRQAERERDEWAEALYPERLDNALELAAEADVRAEAAEAALRQAEQRAEDAQRERR